MIDFPLSSPSTTTLQMRLVATKSPTVSSCPWSLMSQLSGRLVKAIMSIPFIRGRYRRSPLASSMVITSTPCSPLDSSFCAEAGSMVNCATVLQLVPVSGRKERKPCASVEPRVCWMFKVSIRGSIPPRLPSLAMRTSVTASCAPAAAKYTSATSFVAVFCSSSSSAFSPSLESPSVCSCPGSAAKGLGSSVLGATAAIGGGEGWRRRLPSADPERSMLIPSSSPATALESLRSCPAKVAAHVRRSASAMRMIVFVCPRRGRGLPVQVNPVGRDAARRRGGRTTGGGLDEEADMTRPSLESSSLFQPVPN